jgi:hypothetical protein
MAISPLSLWHIESWASRTLRVLVRMPFGTLIYATNRVIRSYLHDPLSILS